MSFKEKLKKRKELKENNKKFKTLEEYFEYFNSSKAVRFWWKKIMDFLYYDVWCTIEEYIIEPIWYFPREVKFFYQRGTRGWADNDTWSFAYALAPRILGMLEFYKKNKYGFPSTINPKTGKYSYNEKRWDKIVDKMIYSFKTMKDIDNQELVYLPLEQWDNDFYKKNRKIHKTLTKKETEKYEEGLKLFFTNIHSLWS